MYTSNELRELHMPVAIVVISSNKCNSCNCQTSEERVVILHKAFIMNIILHLKDIYI